jgi:hypothetical protein
MARFSAFRLPGRHPIAANASDTRRKARISAAGAKTIANISMKFGCGMWFLKTRAANIEGQEGLQSRNEEEWRRADETEENE